MAAGRKASPKGAQAQGPLAGPCSMSATSRRTRRPIASIFDQTAAAQDGSLTLGRVGAHRGCAMSKTDEFWLYAREAILSASYAKTDEERLGLLDLGQTWTQAALLERGSAVGRDSRKPSLEL